MKSTLNKFQAVRHARTARIGDRAVSVFLARKERGAIYAELQGFAGVAFVRKHLGISPTSVRVGVKKAGVGCPISGVRGLSHDVADKAGIWDFLNAYKEELSKLIDSAIAAEEVFRNAK